MARRGARGACEKVTLWCGDAELCDVRQACNLFAKSVIPVRHLQFQFVGTIPQKLVPGDGATLDLRGGVP